MAEAPLFHTRREGETLVIVAQENVSGLVGTNVGSEAKRLVDHLTRLNTLWPIYPTRKEAMDAVRH
jgi:hypothetical protein